MFTLVTGGLRSGKSEYALSRASELGPPPWLYVAPSIEGDDELKARLAKHRRDAEATWKLLEAPERLETVLEPATLDGHGSLLIDRFTEWVANRLARSEKSGYSGAAMYDPLAVATVVDPSVVTLKQMHVDVETKGEFTRGETVANRMGSNENNVLHGDHYEIEGVIELKPNAKVCLASDRERFLQLLIGRIQGK